MSVKNRSKSVDHDLNKNYQYNLFYTLHQSKVEKIVYHIHKTFCVKQNKNLNDPVYS